MEDLFLCAPFEFLTLACVLPQRGELLERAMNMMVKNLTRRVARQAPGVSQLVKNNCEGRGAFSQSIRSYRISEPMHSLTTARLEKFSSDFWCEWPPSVQLHIR